MGIDSSELTFVRCPACRSLVPAMSKICRMCGAGLEGGVKSDESQQGIAQRSMRVRQRTMTAPHDELATAVNRIREEMDKSSEISLSSLDDVGHQAENSAEDPLGAFIEEVSVDEQVVGEDLVDNDPIHDGTPLLAGGVSPYDLREPTGGDLDFSGLPASDNPIGSVLAEPSEGQEPPYLQPVPAAVETPSSSQTRVIIESGNKRQPKDTPLSFTKPRVEPLMGRSVTDAPAENRRPVVGEEKREVVGSIEVPRKEGTRPGKLNGWLVSYKNTDGESIELREGKFFVTRNSLRENDLIVDDPSITSPHAQIAIGQGHAMRVQDLMSDLGVHVKQVGSSEYRAVTETIDIAHGDWIKFGDVDFQVSLIAHVGEK